MTFANPPEAETQEDRFVEFELHVPKTAAEGTVSIPAHALYYVCENKRGKCRYLRQDSAIKLEVDKNAPTLHQRPQDAAIRCFATTLSPRRFVH